MKWSVISTLLCSALISQHAFSAKTQYPVTLENCGYPITIEHAPKRAVFHDINMSEMAFSLGLQAQTIGVTGITGWYKMSPSFQQQLGDIPELAPKYPSLETMVVAKPDFFFAGWNYGMKVGGEVTPQTLKPYGINTLILSESCSHVGKTEKASLDLLYQDMTHLGIIFDQQDKAQQLIQSWQERVDHVKQRASQFEEGAPNVFLYDSGEDKPFTAGKYAMPTALIEAAGGKNITDSLAASWATTSWENVATQDPDIIILLDYQSANGADDLKHFLEQHPLMKHTRAVKNSRYVKLRYEELTPGPANIEAIELLSAAFFPK